MTNGTPSSRDKVMRLLSEHATKHGLELVVDWAYANTGTLRVQRPDSLKDILTATFDFQDAGTSFVLRHAGIKREISTYDGRSSLADCVDALKAGIEEVA